MYTQTHTTTRGTMQTPSHATEHNTTNSQPCTRHHKATHTQDYPCNSQPQGTTRHHKANSQPCTSTHVHTTHVTTRTLTTKVTHHIKTTRPRIPQQDMLRTCVFFPKQLLDRREEIQCWPANRPGCWETVRKATFPWCNHWCNRAQWVPRSNGAVAQRSKLLFPRDAHAHSHRRSKQPWRQRSKQLSGQRSKQLWMQG